MVRLAVRTTLLLTPDSDQVATQPDTSQVFQRLRIVIRGAVQGVGFRPFIYRLASELSLTGWVSNTSSGVFIEVQGPPDVLKAFLLRIRREHPPHASIQSLESSLLDPLAWETFEIRSSAEAGPRSVLVLPDIAPCADCLAEVFDPSNRRYRYPFTNCTNCGPRFTIIESLPYNRARTSMKAFPMCPECEREYDDPRDRRFHAQPNACPVCGPHVELWDASGATMGTGDQALREAARAIRSGEIVAVKGIGGFHLVVDAANDAAVRRLRERKRREEKPLALMYPSLGAIRSDCVVSDLEERLLESPEAPIVLLERHQGRSLCASEAVAPNNPYLGAMLPCSPLHHVLLRELSSAIVATSGNLSDEPICTDEREALDRLRGIAELFLVHNRPIVRHVDDSILRIMMGRELVLRRARGYAPLPVRVPHGSERTVLGVGAHLKSAIAMTSGQNVFISQHIGDLETHESFEAFTKVIADFQTLYGSAPEDVVCDLHPDYLSTQFARKISANPAPIQHHYAHVASCMAENELDGEVLGVSWDGTGFGTDGTVWGGEFLVTGGGEFRRVATLLPFRLPGGERAIKEPRRTALGVLAQLMSAEELRRSSLATLSAFQDGELDLLLQMLERGINAPWTSSVGRLFDAVASLLGIRQVVRFEGQAAMELEFVLDPSGGLDRYEFSLDSQSSESPGGIPGLILIDWKPVVSSILSDRAMKVPVGPISRRFHNALAEMIAETAERVKVPKVVLTGGCFQNRYLTERAVTALRSRGFQVYWHQRVPPNDGGIALGQVYAWILKRRGAGSP